MKRACPNKVMVHMWFMHDAHLSNAFLFLDIRAEYTLQSMTMMITPCVWYVVGMKLVMYYISFPQAPFGEHRDLLQYIGRNIVRRGGIFLCVFCCFLFSFVDFVFLLHGFCCDTGNMLEHPRTPRIQSSSRVTKKRVSGVLPRK